MMSVDDTLMCSFQILKPAEKKNQRYQFTGSPAAAPAAPAPGAPAPGGGIYAPTAGAAAGAGGSRPSTPPKGPQPPAAAAQKKK
jgi:hypothetical protein